jgi:hypothetical protein
MSERHVKERLLKYFEFNEPGSTTGSLAFALSTAAETTLAAIELKHIRSNDRVLIEAAVGWQTNAIVLTNAEIIFRIHRDGIGGPIVYSTVDSTGTAILNSRYTTGLVHTETGVVSGEHTYTLTAQIVTAGAALSVIGPVSLEGSVIDENDT